jgi:hypothetical protein
VPGQPRKHRPTGRASQLEHEPVAVDEHHPFPLERRHEPPGHLAIGARLAGEPTPARGQAIALGRGLRRGHDRQKQAAPGQPRALRPGQARRELVAARAHVGPADEAGVLDVEQPAIVTDDDRLPGPGLAKDPVVDRVVGPDRVPAQPPPRLEAPLGLGLKPAAP